MSGVLVTGSADGLGLAAAQLLIENGHEVTLHARSEERSAETHPAAVMQRSRMGCWRSAGNSRE